MRNTPEKTLETIVRAADDRQAKDIIAIDMRDISVMSDYNVITHGSNNRLINAIADGVIKAAENIDVNVRSIEGKQDGNWVLIDLGDVIVHVFDEDERSHYKLESLWTEAPSVDISDWITE